MQSIVRIQSLGFDSWEMLWSWACVPNFVYLPFRCYLSLAADKVSGSAKRSGYGRIRMSLCNHIVVFPFYECFLIQNYIQGVSERTVQSVVLEPFRNLMVYRVE